MEGHYCTSFAEEDSGLAAIAVVVVAAEVPGVPLDEVDAEGSS